MSVIDNVSFQILAINLQPYKGKNGKADGTMYKAQCIVNRDGVTKIGELFLPRALIETPPGHYFAEYAMDVDYSKDVTPMIVGLHQSKPFAGHTAAAAAVATTVGAAMGSGAASVAPAVPKG